MTRFDPNDNIPTVGDLHLHTNRDTNRVVIEYRDEVIAVLTTGEVRQMVTDLSTASSRIKDDYTHEVIGDEYSGHGLPMGARVYALPKDPKARDPRVTWYTQGIVGDERAIDRRDLREVN